MTGAPPGAARPPGAGLARRLGTRDAVFVGLGAMLGAGVFSAFAPAAGAAGGGLLAGLVVAGAVASCNAISSARLAAARPRAGGAYVHGRERLGEGWGFVAGWSFVAGKLASCAAMALTLGAYAWPDGARALAVAAVLLAVAIDSRGIERTAEVTRVVVVAVVAVLCVAAAVLLGGGAADAGRLGIDAVPAPGGVLQSAGLLFFAFAGYARMATLAEEVVDPARTLLRAIPLALGVALLLYAVVGVALLAVLGPDRLAGAQAPLADAARAAGADWLEPVVRGGAVVASFGVLLSLLAGVGRTTFAMARDDELPRVLAHLHPRHRVPARAEWVIAAGVCALVSLADLGEAIGASSFLVLTYYGVANAAALRLGGGARRIVPVAGLFGCGMLALSLPPVAVVAGAITLAGGLLARAAIRRIA